ncbi:MAG: protease modulator HflC [Desulfomonilaceae bacterium]
MGKIIGIVVLGLVVVSQTFFVIQEWEQGLVLEFGKPVRIVPQPGLYAKYPLIQELLVFEKRIMPAEARPAEYVTVDKKRLTVDTVSRWKIVDPLVFYQTVRNEPGAVARLNDIIFARLRQEVANHTFKGFIREEREKIMAQVTLGTAEAAKPFGISVIDVRIKRVDLPEEVQASVFARMKAERERIAKRYRAEGEEQAKEIRANAEKEREIILAEAYRKGAVLRGEGDAEATGIYAAAYGRDKEFYSFIRHLEVYKQILGAEATVLMKPDSSLLRYLYSPGAATQ